MDQEVTILNRKMLLKKVRKAIADFIGEWTCRPNARRWSGRTSGGGPSNNAVSGCSRPRPWPSW